MTRRARALPDSSTRSCRTRPSIPIGSPSPRGSRRRARTRAPGCTALALLPRRPAIRSRRPSSIGDWSTSISIPTRPTGRSRRCAARRSRARATERRCCNPRGSPARSASTCSASRRCATCPRPSALRRRSSRSRSSSSSRAPRDRAIRRRGSRSRRSSPEEACVARCSSTRWARGARPTSKLPRRMRSPGAWTTPTRRSAWHVTSSRRGATSSQHSSIARRASGRRIARRPGPGSRARSPRHPKIQTTSSSCSSLCVARASSHPATPSTAPSSRCGSASRRPAAPRRRSRASTTNVIS